MNELLILAPVGMLIVGLASMIYWKIRGEASFKYFLWGGLIWVLAIIPKILMDYTITSTINRWAVTTFGLAGLLLVSGVYVGFRTGILECGLTYLALSKTRLRNVDLSGAVAFGIGFGGFEAILIALPLLIQYVTFMLNPSLIQLLPENVREAVEIQLNMPTWVVLAPVVERLFVILIHIFTTLMIYASIRGGKLKLLGLAILYKTVLDGLIPYIHWALNPTISPRGAYLAEIWPGTMALIAVLGIRYYFRTLESPSGNSYPQVDG